MYKNKSGKLSPVSRDSPPLKSNFIVNHLLYTIFGIFIFLLSLESCDSSARSEIVQKQPPITYFPQDVLEMAVTLTLDGSGSGKEPKGTFSTIRLSVDDVCLIIDEIATAGGGLLYLTYIDDDSRNNVTYKVRIPTLKYKARPVLREAYFAEADYDQVKKEHQTQVDKFYSDSLTCVKMIEDLKEKERNGISNFLARAYSGKTKENDYSDVNGAVNNDISILRSDEVFAVMRKVLILVSDCVHDIKALSKKDYDPELIPISDKEMEIFQINSVESGNVNLRKTWLPVFDNNALKTIFKNH